MARTSHSRQAHALDRRGFIRAAASAGAAVAATGLPTPLAAAGHPRAPLRPDRVEPWGRIERVAEGVWALVSTPLVDDPRARLTLANGGIIAGREGVMVVEAFASAEGAAWMSDAAHRLTGRRPTHVVMTHYHGDHAAGGAGFLLAGERPSLLATRATRGRLAEQEAALPEDMDRARGLLLPDVVLPDAGDPTEIDLGGRSVRLVPRRGHTSSDLVVEVDRVVYAGDLVWNGLFPNYMDAIPTELSRHVRALRDQSAGLYVSGHGELATPRDLDRYIDLLDHVEEAAVRAIEAGRPLEEAAADYRVPASLGDWHMFSPRYPEVAFRAWQREHGG